MYSPDVAAALYPGAPDAAGQLYDAHAEALFQYCWLTLRNRQHAQTAVCDALVQAGARVAELNDPGTLRAWLFTLARAECHLHPRPSLGDTDEPIARPEQPDAALRIMAWNSVMSLDLVERQALDLSTRHGMTAPEIGLILSLPLPGITGLLASAREKLTAALGAEILVSLDSLECPGRTETILGWTGTVTLAFRGRLLEHARSCEVCRPRLPRNVSPGRIFGLLPAPAMDRDARGHVIARVRELVWAEPAEPEPGAAGFLVSSLPVSSLPLDGRPPVTPSRATPPPVTVPPATPWPAGPELAAVAPEAVPAREAVPAPAPVPQPDPAMPDPVAPAPAETPPAGGTKRRRRRAIRMSAGMGAAAVALAVAAGLACISLVSSSARLSGADSQFVPVTETPAQAGTSQPIPRPDAPPATPRARRGAKKSSLISRATGAGSADAIASGKQVGHGPDGATGAIVTQVRGAHRTVTVAVVPSPSPTATSTKSAGSRTHMQTSGQLTVNPAGLSLGSGSTGQLTLDASGGPVSWTASTSFLYVSMSPASGRLAAGHSVTVTVTVHRHGPGGGSTTVWINGADAPVMWAATAGATRSSSSGAGGRAAAPARRHDRPAPGGSPVPASS